MHREIKNIRYSRDGKIAFDFRGHTILIREPMDVLLVDGGEAAQRWIASGYEFLLAFLRLTTGNLIDLDNAERARA